MPPRAKIDKNPGATAESTLDASAIAHSLDITSTLLAEVVELRKALCQSNEEMASFRKLYEQQNATLSNYLVAPNIQETNAHIRAEVPPITVFVSLGTLARKPFVFKFAGRIEATVKLSSIRAVILLVLLMDLRERANGGSGIVNAVDLMLRALRILENEENNSSERDDELLSNIRVALYRFADYLKEEKPLLGPHVSLSFNFSRLQLAMVDGGGHTMDPPLAIDIGSNDPRIARIVDQASTLSPISRVRQRKALYLSPTPDGADQFLLEMYDHPHRLNVTSLYVRPPFQSYPAELLELIDIPAKTLHRKRIAFEGYKSKRFSFLEILPRETMWDLIRLSEHGHYKLYPAVVTKSHICDHLDNLVYILTEYEHYTFCVTDAAIPFALVNYEIHSGVVPEYFTVFFQAFSSARSRDLGCFVLYDSQVYLSIMEHIVRWILAHPSTIRDRNEVIHFLKQIRHHLVTYGPLQPNDPTPLP